MLSPLNGEFFQYMTFSKDENKSIIYVSIFIALILNSFKILRIFGEVDTVGEFLPHFTLLELIYQLLFQICFCYSIGFFTFKKVKNVSSYELFNVKTILTLVLLTIVFWFVGSRSQELIFNNVYNERIFYGVYLLRFFISTILTFIIVELLLLNRQKNVKELENEKLKSSYLNSKLDNLKAQINPHFLFNSFANLSSLINKDQQKAIKYLSNLSHIFRSTLKNTDEQIVDLVDELALLNSYIKLHKIRVEDGLSLHIDLPDTKKRILHMSLQPLMENVIKHNELSKENPVGIYLKLQGDLLIFRNDLKAKDIMGNSMGIGLFNLNERYKILVGKEINIQKSEKYFSVGLPLI